MKSEERVENRHDTVLQSSKFGENRSSWQRLMRRSRGLRPQTDSPPIRSRPQNLAPPQQTMLAASMLVQSRPLRGQISARPLPLDFVPMRPSSLRFDNLSDVRVIIVPERGLRK